MPPGRSRKFAPKVKTGCHTCRIRRVKCDEQKPACQRCLSTGRKCDGYEHYSSSGTPFGRSLIQISGDAEERRLFHHFRTLTTCEFSGDFESRFWSCIVLQACNVNSSLRHAAIALASLHEDFLVSQGRTKSQQRIYDKESFALRQYTNALEGTRKSLKDKGQSIIVTLMSCVLFFCFENLRGQLASAIIHLQSGLNILNSSMQLDGSSMASKIVIQNDILGVFTRLGFQANYFIDKTHPVNQVQIVRQLQTLGTHRLKRISTLGEAQASLYARFNENMFSHHVEEPIVDLNSFSTKYHMTRCAQLILSHDRSTSFDEGREKRVSAFNEWQTAFEEFIETQGRFMTSKDIRGSTLLKLHHLVAVMMLTTGCGSPKEKPELESTIRNFKQILEWSKFLAATHQPIGSLITPALSPDVGIIAPLFFMATKCPNSILRAEAREILASGPRREGVWDADQAVKIIDGLNIQAK